MPTTLSARPSAFAEDARTILSSDDEPPQLCRTESRCLSLSPDPCSDSRAYEPEVRAESRPYDSTQEMRAMILSALPLPPLPVVVQRIEDDGRIASELVQTSHDVLSNLLLHACARNDQGQNAERKKRQHEVLRLLVASMYNKGEWQPIPDLYHTYCRHTLLHILTYLPPEAPPPGIRFMPLDSVCKGDPTHRRMCDYMAGQALLLGEPNGRASQDWLCREYADMLAMARGRLLHERDGCGDPDVEEDDILGGDGA